MLFTPALLLAALAGLGTGFSLIVAIGAQNAFVLRQGIQRKHVLLVVAICALSDLLLIVLGVAGVGAVAKQVPIVLEVIRWIGVAFLLVYGFLAVRRAFRPSSLVAEPGASSKSWIAIALTCLAFTWLNPHVYLDTLVLLGSIANTHGVDGRWFFAAGAAIASLVWFGALGFGARFLSGFFAKPIAWRILDGLIAVMMVGLAAALALTA